MTIRNINQKIALVNKALDTSNTAFWIAINANGDVFAYENEPQAFKAERIWGAMGDKWKIAVVEPPKDFTQECHEIYKMLVVRKALKDSEGAAKYMAIDADGQVWAYENEPSVFMATRSWDALGDKWYIDTKVDQPEHFQLECYEW